MASRRALNLGEYDEVTRSIRVLASTPNPVEGEALESWDLTRFEKNPVILWVHDQKQLPLGTADEIATGPEGLSMRITLLTRDANPFVQYIEHQLKERSLRGVSVGFDPGEATQEVGEDGQLVTRRSANKLCEVSFVPVPKDEDAGTEALHADAGEKLRHTERLDATLSKVEFTPWGFARISTRFARVGVLQYPNRREYKSKEQLFRPESMATLKGMPVIDIEHHTDFVRPRDARGKTLGFVEEVHADGEYLAGTIMVHDAEAIERIRRGERLDVSAGYYAPTDRREGSWGGEHYDFVQRDIIYNHVALCPPGRGRAGPEVGMKLDVRDVGNGAGSTRTPRVTSAESRTPRA